MHQKPLNSKLMVCLAVQLQITWDNIPPWPNFTFLQFGNKLERIYIWNIADKLCQNLENKHVKNEIQNSHSEVVKSYKI